MILSKLVGVSLLVSVHTGPLVAPEGTARALSLQQKSVVIQTLMRAATECIARAVTADPRYRVRAAELGDLIVASVPTCVTPVRAMIDAHDRFFGDGSGEEFFMGPYLDALPAAVSSMADAKSD
jgi:hypothetical protein